MKAKILFTAIILTALFASCNESRRTNSATHDEGVVINGIRWATRNVDMPGTFAATPESFGMFYQWNRKVAWNVTDRIIDDWDNTISVGTEWYAKNDPCPEGWRIPTREELQNLFNTASDSEWTTLNGVNGRIFGAYNQIFFPAAGGRMNGTLYNTGYMGLFWSSSSGGTDFAQGLMIVSDGIGYCGYDKVDGFSIRCVAK